MHLSISGILTKINTVTPKLNMKILELHNCELNTVGSLLAAFNSSLRILDLDKVELESSQLSELRHLFSKIKKVNKN